MANPRSGNPSPAPLAPTASPTLGAQAYFDVPTMLVMLVVGSSALALNISGQPFRSLEREGSLALLGIYAASVAFNLLDTIVRLRGNAKPLRFLRWVPRWVTRWRGNEPPAMLNFLLDIAFVVGVVALDQGNESRLTLTMLVLAGIRFMAHVAGRPTRLVVLPATLPFLFLGLQQYYALSGDTTDSDLAIEVLLMVCLLAMFYAITGNINQRIAEEAGLTQALAERDELLKVSEINAELDAKRLAEQVLRLDLLQDGIRAMNSAIELDDLLMMVVTNAVRVLKAEQSSIGLIDPQTGELVIQCATGVEASELGRKRFAPGVGVAGWVAQNGKPLIVGDVRMDIRYVDPYTDGAIGRTTRSMLCVPLTVEQKVIGTLCVTHSQPNALNKGDQNLLASFAEQAALAVHKSQLLDERTRQSDELKRREELISSLHSIGQSILSSLDLPQVLNTIISRISELSIFDHGLIYLLNELTGEEELVADSTHSDIGGNTSAAILRDSKPVSDLRKQAQVTGTAQVCDDDVCFLCLPLTNRGKYLGCILLGREELAPFSEVERDTAEKLAHAATIAIINARLFSRVSTQQQQTDALYRLMIKVNSAPNRKQLAQMVCQELMQITGARSAALLINNIGQARFSCWAVAGEWRGYDFSHIFLPTLGHPFISSVLASLHQTSAPGIPVVHNVPQEVRQVFHSSDCVTIPLAHSGRIYGLLVVETPLSPSMSDGVQETVNLAVSHSTVALERAELVEQTLTSARQSSVLYSIATEIQTSLDPATVIKMTVNGALEALPVESCEVYILDEDRKYLRRSGAAVAAGVNEAHALHASEVINADNGATLLATLRSPGLVVGDIEGERQSKGKKKEAQGEQAGVEIFDNRPKHAVVLGRLMGSEEPLGILRLTTALPVDEFVQRHATFCQTLLTHSGGALERSRLYTTTDNQARMLRHRAQQLTDILDLGSLSAADVPFETLMPRIAAGIARSLSFAYVRIGEIGSGSSETEIWAASDQTWPQSSGVSSRALSMDSLDLLMQAGKPAKFDVKGIYLDEATLNKLVPEQQEPKAGEKPRPLILMLLESTGGGTLGYILAALNSASDIENTDAERDLLEVMGIFAQKASLIIENHRVYSQLLDSKRKIEAVVLSISDGIIVTDADLNVLITNDLANKLLAAQAGASQGYPLKWLINNDKLIDLLNECVQSSISDSMDVDLYLGHDLRTYQAVVHPMTAPDTDVLGAVLTLRDVTLERAIERAKSDFLSIVSHELRTPLNSVMGFLDIILMGKTGPITDLQVDFLSTAKQEAVVLQRLINDLLDASQLQSRVLRLEMAPVNLSTLIARVVNQSVPRMLEDQLTIVNEVPPELIVIGDEIRIEQVFKNLLDNAAKFTDSGGQITFAYSLDEDRVTISVRDNGCGIPPSQINEVFERFFQAENNSNRQRRGLGLGLAICKNIVDAHGGRIWLESEMGMGTTVYVELLLFKSDSPYYEFDQKTGKATLAAPRQQAITADV